MHEFEMYIGWSPVVRVACRFIVVMACIAFGRCDDSFSASSLKAYLAEFISTLLFIASVGSAVAYGHVNSAMTFGLAASSLRRWRRLRRCLRPREPDGDLRVGCLSFSSLASALSLLTAT
ncbi:hypothetical protein Cni_G04560 [Canna indica]|uniref:Uncharacterized protein n=1 Tax=Canna indica TaxID=4628 RepID=A0AAQ3JSX8_9LILI|nr:hypothetical protein Cni_G04560 [Canna indica]